MFLVGVAGGSGSGKTTFSKKVMAQVPQEHLSEIALLHLDSYYLPQPPRELRIHGEPNFDHPGAFDWDLVQDHLRKLRSGKSVEVPVYDFTISRRTKETMKIGPCRCILFEGIFALWDPKILELFDLKIFLHVDSDIRFIRRLHRDVRERGRNLDGIIRQYYDSVRPMHHEYIEPTRQFADLIVGEETDIAAEVVAARVANIVS